MPRIPCPGARRPPHLRTGMPSSFRITGKSLSGLIFALYSASFVRAGRSSFYGFFGSARFPMISRIALLARIFPTPCSGAALRLHPARLPRRDPAPSLIRRVFHRLVHTRDGTVAPGRKLRHRQLLRVPAAFPMPGVALPEADSQSFFFARKRTVWIPSSDAPCRSQYTDLPRLRCGSHFRVRDHRRRSQTF